MSNNNNPRPPTKKELEKEFDLDPIEKIKVKRTLKHEKPIQQMKQIKKSYDAEGRALETTGDCNNGGPRV